jgi:serine/threonine protein kinase
MSVSTESKAPKSGQEIDGFSAGSIVGRYRLIAPLASGGMAHVWTAEPEAGSGLGHNVAIKLIKKDLASDKDYSRMFIDEATIASAIDHPNVCRTFELEQHDGTLFMAMEWVPGDSLMGLLRQGKEFVPLDAGLAARICADACAGLHAAHEAVGEDGAHLGVIHRDVSPPNILISLQGQVKVSDFGIAKARQQLHERTKTGEVKGKFGYLAPEQITGSKGDRRIDVYAMGCVLYIATVGLRPFGNGPQAMTKILKGAYRKPSEVDAMYPPGLEEIVVRALQHRPEDRFSSTDEMRVALEEWLAGARLIVTQEDIAAALLGRMDPAKLAHIKKLRSRPKRSVQHSYSALLDAYDENEPPTAVSGIVVPPGDLMRKSRSIPPAKASHLLSTVTGDDVDATVRTAVDVKAPDGAADQSGWYRTGEHDVQEAIDEARQEPTETEVMPPRESARPRVETKVEVAQKTGSGALVLQAALAGLVVLSIVWFLLQ